jgi:glucose-6-phosphate dehydrogenase assembly protein OpcA
MTSSTSVDITSIEHELRRLWQDNTPDPSSSSQALTRALTLNLVVVTHDPAAINPLTETIQQLTASHPTRAVLLVYCPELTEPRLESTVQANCLLTAPGAPQVCGEQITITAHGSATRQADSLILPLLVPDLPLVLWMDGTAPFAEPLFQRLRGVADRIIVDSDSFSDPLRDFVQLADLEAGSGPQSPILSDLAWTRLTPWRELTAQFFDARPLLPHLHRIDQIEIEYVASSTRPNPILAFLFSGWLAACLNWKPLEDAVSEEGDTIRLHLRRPAVGVGPNAIRLVTIDQRPAPDTGSTLPGLATIRLHAVDNVLASFVVARTDDPYCARTTAEVNGMPAVERLARIDRQSQADLIAAELRLLSHDDTFSAALRMAGTFARRLQ